MNRPEHPLPPPEALDASPFAPLFVEADEIVDRAALKQAIDALAGDGPVNRAAAVEPLRAALTDARARIAAALKDNPTAAQAGARAYSAATDAIVCEAIAFAETWIHPNPNPTKTEQVCVLAVGGYGRAEMAPFSDVDLLFLTPYKNTPWGESVVESVLYILWDLKLKVGQSVRTIEDCLRLAREDLTIRTTLLEHRYLYGPRDLAETLDARLWDELFSRTGPDFVEAKLEERAQRHKSHGGSRYMLEPNLKEGKGGLRDLQTLFWIAKYLHHAATPRDLVTLGVFTREEFDIFDAAEAFLWAVRHQLHLAAGRANEKLTYDMQVEVARALGFQDGGGRRAVEHFMQVYFRHAMRVGELTRIFIAALEAQHVKRGPRLARALRSAFNFGERASEGYMLTHGRLDVADPDAFFLDPLNILRLFAEALDKRLEIHPDALRKVAQSLHLIDDTVRNDPDANALFLDMLLSRNNPERALRQLNETGVLGAFMPEFGRIVAMMQFNLYHHYTVDEHTIQCISNLFEIEQGRLEDELPIASGILKRGVNRRVIYVAMLLHDIGKGLPQDHSTIGAGMASEICPRLGLDEDETETVVWLVQNHLVMSDMAQKRDLTDPGTVEAFAQIVKGPTRLKLLMVLTVCDIRGVSPSAWNNWKAVLLRQLYRETLAFLTEGATRQSRPERVEDAKETLRARLSGDPAATWPKDQIEEEVERHYDSYWLGLQVDVHARIADLNRNLPPGRPAVAITEDPSRDATLACFAMPDHPGIFSRLTGAVALAGANVVDARCYTTRDGLAQTAFWLQDRDGQPYENARLDRLRRSIDRTLRGEVLAREEFKTRDRVPKRESQFRIQTEITMDNEGSDIFTIIEVDTRDRPGLLHDLTRTLAALNITISSAIIATFGEQAVDTFYVKDVFGLKIHSRPKQEAITEKLKAAIARGAERAQG